VARSAPPVSTQQTDLESQRRMGDDEGERVLCIQAKEAPSSERTCNARLSFHIEVKHQLISASPAPQSAFTGSCLRCILHGSTSFYRSTHLILRRRPGLVLNLIFPALRAHHGVLWLRLDNYGVVDPWLIFSGMDSPSLLLLFLQDEESRLSLSMPTFVGVLTSGQA
jgi:hypothetical protein